MLGAYVHERVICMLVLTPALTAIADNERRMPCKCMVRANSSPNLDASY